MTVACESSIGGITWYNDNTRTINKARIAIRGYDLLVVHLRAGRKARGLAEGESEGDTQGGGSSRWLRWFVEVGEEGSRLKGDRRAEEGDFEEADPNEGSDIDSVGLLLPSGGLMAGEEEPSCPWEGDSLSSSRSPPSPVRNRIGSRGELSFNNRSNQPTCPEQRWLPRMNLGVIEVGE